MENELEFESKPVQPTCLSCGTVDILPEYPNPLCANCRANFIKFPIPIGIKLFAAGIAIVFILAMIRLPKNLSAGIHLERGKKAEKKENYFTAQQEYEKVLSAIPALEEAKCHLLVASFYNLDFETVVKMSTELEGKSIEDGELYKEMSGRLQALYNYFPSDSFNIVLAGYPSADSIPEDVFRSYIPSHPDEIYPLVNYASILFDKEKFTDCEEQLHVVLSKDDYHIAALAMMASSKRERGQLDSSLYYCDRLLSHNRESLIGVSSKARTFFKQHKDKQGMQWALKAYELDNTEPFSVATMTLAYHLTNKKEDRDKLLEKTKNDTLIIPYMKRVQDIISGKEKFRD